MPWKWFDTCDQLKLAEFFPCRRMLKNWKHYILNSFDYLCSNAFTVHCNNAIKALSAVPLAFTIPATSVLAFYAEPTIRPVLDLSDVTSGFQTVDNLFNTERMLGGASFNSLSALRSARAMPYDQGGIGGKTDNRDVVAELQRLSKQFDELSCAVSNMQVVLDTGVLVGQTSRQMDAQLGTLASRRGREN